MIMRIVYFLATNIAVMFVLGIVMSILGVDPQTYTGSLIMCGIFGMVGSFISLAMSKSAAKRMSGARVIETPANEEERWLLNTVQHQAEAAGIGMPEVAIVDSPQVNAFATGMNKNNALVAVYRGLLQSMSRDEAEAVMAHEITHVANGDMVTLALIQGVVNTFVMFVSRIIAGMMRNRGSYMLVYFVMQFVLGILASIIVAWFSRKREFRADAGGASLASRDKMIGALERLKAQHDPEPLPDELAAFGISGSATSGIKKLFLSHPPLEERIDALKEAG